LAATILRFLADRNLRCPLPRPADLASARGRISTVSTLRP